MSNILIHMLVNPHSEYDIFSGTDYASMAYTFRSMHISCPNLGNRLWFQGLVSEISGEENTLTFFREDMSKDYINANFDMIIAPMANVFHAAFSDLLHRLAMRFQGIRIPVYVIACGVQTARYQDLDALCSTIGAPSRSFMKSVYDTGGEFALRGYFTKEFFDRMGFSTAVVTGCPSLYQLGRDLQIPENKVSHREFRPLINGDTRAFLPLAQSYPNAEFFDQERFFHILHDPNCAPTLRTLVHLYGFETTRWLLSEKIRMIPNMNDWFHYLKEQNFHFSFGSRIHGSIMPILAGIPAAIAPQDARTREMAFFFEIPVLERRDKSLYDLYLETDYSAFNRYFSEKYDAYEQFLISRGIVKKCNPKNDFFFPKTVHAESGNHQRLHKLHDDFRNRQWLWKGYDTALQWKRNFTKEE